VSLALAEVLVHLDPSNVPSDYVLVTIDIPDSVPIRRASPEQAMEESVQPIAPVYEVASVVVPQEFNYVIFPRAAGFTARVVKIEPFRIDERLALLVSLLKP
jgi:hypothetical protein